MKKELAMNTKRHHICDGVFCVVMIRITFVIVMLFFDFFAA